MQKIAIYWNNDSSELQALPDVRVSTCGNDGMEVLGNDADIQALYKAVLENPDKYTLAQDPTAATKRDLEAVLEFNHPDRAWPGFYTIDEVLEYLAS